MKLISMFFLDVFSSRGRDCCATLKRIRGLKTTRLTSEMFGGKLKMRGKTWKVSNLGMTFNVPVAGLVFFHPTLLMESAA